jgi:hypothetical protein
MAVSSRPFRSVRPNVTGFNSTSDAFRMANILVKHPPFEATRRQPRRSAKVVDTLGWEET